MKINPLVSISYPAYKHQMGFNLIETMIALAMLAVLTVCYLRFNSVNLHLKDAKVLSSQTSNYAVIFARYLRNNQAVLMVQAKNNPVVLSPNTIESSWPADLAKLNLFLQTPCLAVVTNQNTSKLEAIMYYTGGNSNTTPADLEIVRDAAIFLGSQGGILINGTIAGNSGWQINNDSPFLSGSSGCVGRLSNNSLAVNIDLVLDWNQDLQPINSLLRGTDRTTGLLSLPGHVRNANTTKANLYFSQNTGIILDNSNQVNPMKLSVLYNGEGSGAATIGVGNTLVSTLIADTFQPNTQFQAGAACNADEIGKTVVDQGVNNSASVYLARSTLICTQNNMLCGSGAYCYLPTIANNIVFQNTATGIGDRNGNFYCPPEVPFAANYTLSNPSDTVTPIIGSIGQYSVVIGYGFASNSQECTGTCVESGPSTLITSVTCSNAPVYTSTN